MIAKGITLYLLRHGETEWNTERRFQGQSNSPLTEKGRGHARAYGRTLVDIVDTQSSLHFVSSPSGRACETMTLLREALGLVSDTFATDERLLEINAGSFTGITWADIQANHADIWKAHADDPWNVGLAGGESLSDIAARITPWMASLTTDTVAVSHGKTGRVMRGVYGKLSPVEMLNLDEPQDCVFRLTAGSITRIEVLPG